MVLSIVSRLFVGFPLEKKEEMVGGGAQDPKNESESRLILNHGFYLGPRQDRFHLSITTTKATTLIEIGGAGVRCLACVR